VKRTLARGHAEQLHEQLELIREHGYSTDDQENEPRELSGATCLSLVTDGPEWCRQHQCAGVPYDDPRSPR